MKDWHRCGRILFMQSRDENANGWLGSSRAGPSALWANSATATSTIPEDLTEWVPASELARIVAGTVRSADRPAIRAEYAAKWELLLAWTTYAYVTGRFSSEEIAAGLDAAGRSVALCLAHSGVIRQFRRRNRVTLENMVANVIRAAHALREEMLSKGRERPRWGVVEGDHPDFRMEARNRLKKAIQMDCWALDD